MRQGHSLSLLVAAGPAVLHSGSGGKYMMELTVSPESKMLMRASFLQRAEHQKTSMARGVMFVDENLRALIAPLEKAHFKVYEFKAGMRDEDIAPLLSHRVFVTNNAKDFREAAAIHEFSIIDTQLYHQDPHDLAKAISRAWIDLALKGKQPFYLVLRRDGRPILEGVE